MQQSAIPIYNDPLGFDGTNTYPCSTQFMVYNGLEHKYYLTEEGLNHYGIDVERKYINPVKNKTQYFIRLVTKKIYDYINYKAGIANFQVQMYRIATAPTNIYNDQYAFRKAFEQILIDEAQWLIDNGDSAKYSYDNMERGNSGGVKPEEDYRNTNDIAPEAIRALEFLGLSRWFTLAPNLKLNTNKY